MKTILIVIASFISISTVLSDSMKGIVFPDVLYFQSGDSAIWADTSVDYQSWNSFGPKEFPYEKWEGIGWFRFEMLVDSTLCDIPLGMTVEQIGAVEIYIDGERVYQYGKVGRSIDEEEAYLTEWFPKPQPVIFKRKSADSLGFVHYQLAVRYSSFIIETPVTWGAKPRLNFEINDFSEIAIKRAQIRKKAVGHQMLLFGTLFTFGLIHLLFYIYYSKIKANLSFSAIALSAAFLSYLRFESYFITDPLTYVWSLRLFFTLGIFLTIATLQFTYSLLYYKKPKRLRYFFGTGIVLIIILWIWPLLVWSYMFFFFSLIGIEQLRTVISVWMGKRKVLLEGSRIILFGFIPFALVAIYHGLIGFGLFPQMWEFVDFPATFYAILILALSMSVFLSRNFANTNTELEKKLIEVKELSDKTLQQELHRVELEKENERKTRELEGARALQLSMLPKSVPQLENCDISVFMQTATEVGGDYYDFKLEGNNALTIAFGDATGHGMQSGSVVTASKGLFKAWSHLSEPDQILQKISESLKQMGFGRMYMAMIVTKLFDNSLNLSAAGMPDPLIWRKSTGEIEEVSLQGMPLGTFSGFAYQNATFELKKGDAVLLMSDGLPELPDPSGKQMGHDVILNLFKDIAANSTQEILDLLLKKAREWCACDVPEDDLTLMVLKIK
jgi:serine phosphatase RsbU (regulator of sigma subunit)